MNSTASKTLSKDRISELLAKARAGKNILSNVPISTIPQESECKTIQYNEKQKQFIDLVTEGNSAVLIGAAGSGKTTCMRGVMTSLIQSGAAGLLQAGDHKYLKSDTPGIVIVSFTRRAVANIRKAVSEDMKANCITIHSLLEYEPVYYEKLDSEGKPKTTMVFEATRNKYNPLPQSINICVIEEASMVSVELFKELKEALGSHVQYIFLGDIQQLPPVFGSAILGYKMNELPVIELTEIYRQALESPIIKLAHRILSGIPIEASEYEEWKIPNKLTIHSWKKKLASDLATLTLAKFLTTAIDAGAYNPEEDMVLIPFNKSCGTIELNKHIAQHLARKRLTPVFEIIAGFKRLYLSAGDKILYDKEDAVIEKIYKNPSYTGTLPQPESITLDYWGHDSSNTISLESYDDGDIDFLLSQAVSKQEEGAERQASHKLEIRLLENDKIITLQTSGHLNSLDLAFVLTVHKSQGSEFRKVFLLLHQSHATMLQRELLYTAVTRAKEELYIICEPESMKKGILSQKIKGNTLAEKAEWFKGKIVDSKLNSEEEED